MHIGDVESAIPEIKNENFEIEVEQLTTNNNLPTIEETNTGRYVTSTSKRHYEKLSVTFLVLEIYPDRSSVYKEMSLKSLQEYVNNQAIAFDEVDEIKELVREESGPSGAKSDVMGDVSPTRRQRSFTIDRDNTISHIRLRDLRRLEYSLNPLEEPTLLVRRHSVLLSLDPLRAIVMADKLLFIVPDGADSLISKLEQSKNLYICTI
jgi:DNA gyrase/topoisomerase IV subunit A